MPLTIGPLPELISSSAQMAPSPPMIQKMLKPRSASTEAIRRTAGTGVASTKFFGANCSCMAADHSKGRLQGLAPPPRMIAAGSRPIGFLYIAEQYLVAR